MKQDVLTRASEIINSKRDFIGGGMEGYAVLSLINEHGYPTSSTITISKADGINWISFLGGTVSNKTTRIRNCSKASICLASSEYNITLVGTVEIITDPAAKKEHWQDIFAEHYGDVNNPELCALRFTTESYNLYFSDNDIEVVGTLKNPDKKALLKVTPALSFRGQCSQAIELYKEAFGAEVVTMIRYSDADPADLQYSEAEKDFVYYGEMVIGNTLITLADDSACVLDEKTLGKASQDSLLIEFDSADELQAAYKILADNATIIIPMCSTTYCSGYVSLVDKFGIHWYLMSGYAG